LAHHQIKQVRRNNSIALSQLTSIKPIHLKLNNLSFSQIYQFFNLIKSITIMRASIEMSQKQTHKFKDSQRIQILDSFCVLMARRLLLYGCFNDYGKSYYNTLSLVISLNTFHNLLEMFRQHGSIHSKLDRCKTARTAENVESPRLSMRRPVIPGQRAAVDWLMNYTLVLRHVDEF
jgi:hypothetical protein